MTKGCFNIDAVFRGGSEHSNHGDTVQQMVCHMVVRIRKALREQMPIVLRLDADLFDEKAL